MNSLATLMLMMGCLFGSAKEMPCPDPLPAFDHTAIDRTLKEPKYGSAMPAYRFLAFGPEGRTIVALVADESQGTGKGYDTLYVDLNADHDLTGPSERFKLDKSAPAKPVHGLPSHFVLLTLSDWGKDVVKPRKLDVPDPTFDYTLGVVSSFVEVTTATKNMDESRKGRGAKPSARTAPGSGDNGWKTRLVASDGAVPWSVLAAEAPVLRFGGSDFHLKNEDFVWKTEGRREFRENGVGQRLGPGTRIKLDGATPFFAGSSPSVVFRQGSCWAPGGHQGLRACIEAQGGAAPHRTEVVLREY